MSKDLNKRFKDYKKWVDDIRYFNDNVVVGFIIFGCLLFIIFSSTALKIIGAIIAIRALSELVKRIGHKEGYFEGYEMGLHDSVHEGLDDDELAFKDMLGNEFGFTEDKKNKK